MAVTGSFVADTGLTGQAQPSGRTRPNAEVAVFLFTDSNAAVADGAVRPENVRYWLAC